MPSTPLSLEGFLGRSSKPPSVTFVMLPPEVRSIIYGLLFGERVAIVSNPGVSPSSNPSRRPDELAASSRSSQILRVCQLVHNEALPLLYANTIFYLWQRGSLTGLRRLVVGSNIRSVIVRIRLRDVDFDLLDHVKSEMKPLLLNGVNFPVLTSLQVKLVVDTEYCNPSLIDTCRLRLMVLFHIHAIQKAHPQLGLVIMDQRHTGCKASFRLAPAGAELLSQVSIPC
jgi:hypothetical protein